MLNPEFIKIRIFAVLCHFWRLEKVREVRVKARTLILRPI